MRADPLAKTVTQQLATRESNLDVNIVVRNLKQRGELLYKVSVLYIPEVQAIQMEILKKHHDDLLAAHLPTTETYNTLCHKYFWPNMYKPVDKYCTSCLICQRAEVICGKQPGELQPPSIPTKAWDIFSMDLITGLPEIVAYGDIYDAIFVVVAKLSKMYHYIPFRSDMTTEESAEVIPREVIQLHGVPSTIISDRGSVFTSKL